MRLLLIVTFLQVFAAEAQITRGDSLKKNIALVFTGDEFGDGGSFILSTLKEFKMKASFFLTGNFLRNRKFKPTVNGIVSEGHYLGSHSDKHLLYCDWVKRDSLLVTRHDFDRDLLDSYRELARWKIGKKEAPYFLPPYEWYNDSIVLWTSAHGLTLINFTPGTKSHADYTFPKMESRYVSSAGIYASIIDFEKNAPQGLNGFILLVHIGTDPRRTDKFYHMLPRLISEMIAKGYHWVRINELLSTGVDSGQTIISSP
jgi:endoglucanase